MPGRLAEHRVLSLAYPVALVGLLRKSSFPGPKEGGGL